MRVKTGIDGLDKLLGGGFLPKTVNVISGTPGTGKTIFGIQYLVNGAMNGEKGVYISLEESIEDVARFVSGFGWNILDLAKKEMIKVKQFKITPPEETDVPGITSNLKKYSLPQAAGVIDVYSALREELETGAYSRVVIDSASVLKYAADDGKDIRVQLASLFRFLKKHEITTIVNMEKSNTEDSFEFEEFLADSVVRLNDYPTREERKRGVVVLKMRGSKIDRATRPYNITETGIQVYPGEYLL